MTAISVCVVIGVVLLLLMRGQGLRPIPMVVAIVFGLVLASTPAGPSISRALDSTGHWIWQHGRQL